MDLTEEYCLVAEALSVRLGLQDLVSYRTGNALEMPFGHESFDVVWTQHASMKISDKTGSYEETYRVLKPGGRLAIYDILAGPGGEVHLPSARRATVMTNSPRCDGVSHRRVAWSSDYSARRHGDAEAAVVRAKLLV